ncbi:hypothetical protein GGF32_008987, partial [Allomyces javanicus]
DVSVVGHWHISGKDAPVFYSPEKIEQVMAQHPARVKAREQGGLDVLVVYLGLWGDETAGTLSKRHSHFETCNYLVANLPTKIAQHITNQRFIAAGKEITILDVCDAVVDDVIANLETGVLAVDPAGRRVMITGTVALLLGDGPKLSAFSSHAGNRSNHLCRACDHDKRSFEYEIDHVGVLRSNETTEAAINKARALATEKARKAELAGLKMDPNPLRRLQHLDLHQDTVVDALHWAPLGLVKHTMQFLTCKMSTKSNLAQSTMAYID